MECLKIKFILFFHQSANDTEWNAACEAVGTDKKMMRKTPFNFRFWEFFKCNFMSILKNL